MHIKSINANFRWNLNRLNNFCAFIIASRFLTINRCLQACKTKFKFTFWANRVFVIGCIVLIVFVFANNYLVLPLVAIEYLVRNLYTIKYLVLKIFGTKYLVIHNKFTFWTRSNAWNHQIRR